MSVAAQSHRNSLANDPGLISDEVTAFLASPKQLFIGGDWVDSTMPFGGYKQSGWGREMGKESVYAYLESKSMCIRI